MRNFLYILVSFSVLSCTQPEEPLSSDFFENADFSLVSEEDTLYLSFLDTTYSLLSKEGIQQRNNCWSLQTIGGEQFLLLDCHRPSVFQIVSFRETSCTLQRISQVATPLVVLIKSKKERMTVQGKWTSTRMPPPLDYLFTSSEMADSIITNEALWEGETFEFTDDSVKYRFYDYAESVKFEKPFIQLESDLSTVYGPLNALRPLVQDDSTLTLEFYYSKGGNSAHQENKRRVRNLYR